MQFNKVLLISPYYGGMYSSILPAGLGYIAESLERHGIEYDVLDLQLRYSAGEIQRFITAYKPDLVGFSVIAYRYRAVYALAQQIKTWLPDTTIVIGGPFISTFRAQALSDCSAIDYGVVLEGDETIIELCQGIEPAHIQGLLYRDHGEIMYTGDRPFIRDLDTIPFPRYRKFKIGRYSTDVIDIASSRGCQYHCIYCPASLSIGSILRVRSSRSVVDEIEYWYSCGYRRFAFADDNFTFYAKRVHDICAEIELRNMKNLELILGNGIRADRVDKELLIRMKNAGFRHIAFGVESADNRILKLLHKSETIEQIEQMVVTACRIGIGVKLHFIIGSPGETFSDVETSFRFALKYPVEDASFNNLIPYPGTALYQWASENDYLLFPPGDYLNEFSTASLNPVFATPEFPADERKKALTAGAAVRKRILKRNYANLLRSLGPCAGIAASLAVTEFFTTHVLLHPMIRRIVRRMVQHLPR